MRNRGLLRQIPPICGRNGCPRHMTQVKNPSFPTDGCQWRCPTHKGNKQSIRAGSFFERAHFELRKGIMLAYFWALSMSSSYVLYDIWVSLIPIGIPLHTQKQMVQLGSRMLIDWSQFFRDICSRWLIDHPIRLGGVGHVVQIDESLLARRKYNIGHQVNEQWIFGIFDVHMPG